MLLVNDGETADVAGKIVYDGTDFSFRDSAGTFDPRFSIPDHKAARDLIHFIDSGPADGFDSGSYLEILPSGDPFPTSEIWYVDNTKANKIVELTTSYNANKTVSTEVWKMYDNDGSTVLVTLTDTYAYSGVFVTSVTRTWA